MLIGTHRIDPPLVLAPMAGITDRAFRRLCRQMGAGMAVSEMMISDESLWHSEKSRLRREHDRESGPISVQIAGYEPAAMARTAQFHVEHGAQIIDINMGCPAKKVCRVDAGSALLRDEALVGRILEAVVRAVEVPVTLKMRTGWSREQRNAVKIARIAEDCGVAALAVHGRTREDRFEGEAEFETIAQIKRSVGIPLIANGDIDSGEKARAVLQATGVDALMIGRAALGSPWIFRQIDAFLRRGERLEAPDATQTGAILLAHLDELYALYGEGRGLRVARKHIQWYCQSHEGAAAFWSGISGVDDAREQRDRVEAFFHGENRTLLPKAA